jgi:hypothetical protein
VFFGLNLSLKRNNERVQEKEEMWEEGSAASADLELMRETA